MDGEFPADERARARVLHQSSVADTRVLARPRGRRRLTPMAKAMKVCLLVLDDSEHDVVPY